jgi:predicted DNA-binding transcriptional regulator AlpA
MNREIKLDCGENQIVPLPRVAELTLSMIGAGSQQPGPGVTPLISSDRGDKSSNRGLPFELSNDRILPLPLMAELASISIATLRRLIDSKQGPRLTRLSARRIGIRVSHAREWLEARAQRSA